MKRRPVSVASAVVGASFALFSVAAQAQTPPPSPDARVTKDGCTLALMPLVMYPSAPPYQSVVAHMTIKCNRRHPHVHLIVPVEGSAFPPLWVGGTEFITVNLRAHRTVKFFGHEECLPADVSTPFRAKATARFKDHGKTIKMTTHYTRSTFPCS